MSETEQGRLLLPGERLRSGREALGLSQAEISARMHLSVAYIRALEEDNYKRLPDAAFVRGYIKNYAKLVNLPADELISLYRQLYQEIQAEEAAAPAQKVSVPDRRLWWVGGAIGFLIAIWLLWPASVDSPTPQPMERQVIESDAVPAETGDGESENVGEDFQGGAVTAVIAPPAAQAPAVSTADSLAVSFSEACWLRVRDANGDELYVGQRDAGQTLELQGKSPFRITLGNAAAVSAISFNGAAIRVPQAAPGQVITVRAP